MSENLKSKGGVEAFCRRLSGVHSEGNALQTRLRPRHAKPLLEKRLSNPFAAPALGYVEAPEETIVVSLCFRATAEAGAGDQLAVHKCADDKVTVRGVRTEARPGLVDRHRAMLVGR